MLFYGTITGFLISWRQVPVVPVLQIRDRAPTGHQGREGFREIFCKRLAQPSEVTALAFDTTSNRLAVCNYNSSVQIYTLASSAKPCKTFAVNIANFIPKTVHFGAMRGNERELLVFGLHDGKMCASHLNPYILTTRFSRTLTGSSEIDSSSEPWEIGVHIGDAAVDTRRMTVCIDDTEHGAILYRLDDHQRVKTFPVPVTQAKRPRQVRFLDDSRAIVIGSDHGIVYIFDRRTGDIIDKLAVRGESWVQTLATMDCGVPTIFLAKSGEDSGRNDIMIWRKTAEHRFGSGLSETVIALFQVSMLLASLAFAYQNSELALTLDAHATPPPPPGHCSTAHPPLCAIGVRSQAVKAVSASGAAQREQENGIA
ncbi:hypothetical protein DFH07DRAFT_954616 [Mycena maculata]|uniref:WD40 repeat-like protein n=1 Tax=Mycena maculata TaxID=230809 RepID=A0AAD7JPS3_9AGAR|nr:hypothetical protein DFH07DRAFT_954616 [Mycena maculata]